MVLLFYIYEQQSPSMEMLCKNLDISVRTFYRYLAELNDAGILPKYIIEYDYDEAREGSADHALIKVNAGT